MAIFTELRNEFLLNVLLKELLKNLENYHFLLYCLLILGFMEQYENEHFIA